MGILIFLLFFWRQHNRDEDDAKTAGKNVGSRAIKELQNFQDFSLNFSQ